MDPTLRRPSAPEAVLCPHKPAPPRRSLGDVAHVFVLQSRQRHNVCAHDVAHVVHDVDGVLLPPSELQAATGPLDFRVEAAQVGISVPAVGRVHGQAAPVPTAHAPSRVSSATPGCGSGLWTMALVRRVQPGAWGAAVAAPETATVPSVHVGRNAVASRAQPARNRFARLVVPSDVHPGSQGPLVACSEPGADPTTSTGVCSVVPVRGSARASTPSACALDRQPAHDYYEKCASCLGSNH